MAPSENEYNKPALTLDQQIARLRSRRMRISARTARPFLKRVSYYRVSAYWYPFREVRTGQRMERFQEGTMFDDIVTLYEFDRHLRSLMHRVLEQIEIAVRTRITYHLAHLGGGPFAHEHRQNFRSQFRYIEHMSSTLKNVKRSRSTFMLHYRDTYTKNPEHVPIWMFSETMSFGSISKLYKGLRLEIQTAICQDFGIERFQKFEEWLGVLSNLRNVCAHHDRLWNRQLKPTFQSEGVTYRGVRTDRLFYALLVCRYLLGQMEAPDTLHEHWLRALSYLPECTIVNFHEEMGCGPSWQNLWPQEGPLAPHH